jgi:hypothetical protein
MAASTCPLQPVDRALVCAIRQQMRTSVCLRSNRLRFVVAALFVSACQPAKDDQGSNETLANEASRVRPLPVVEAPLDRQAILQAVAKAASAAALGHVDRDTQRDLDGDRFEVRIRFGCPTTQPSVETGPFVVRQDVESRRLEVRASPDLTKAQPWIAALGGDAIEAVEGFWMRKPWLLAPGCSVAPQAPTSEATEDAGDDTPRMSMEAKWRVGIAQFFGPTDTRTTRRDHRAYETTKTLGEDEPVSSEGYDLILSGRLRELPNGQVIACHVASPELPPECVVSVTFDRVQIQRADTKETLAEWSS